MGVTQKLSHRLKQWQNDNLKMEKVEYLSNHWLEPTQIVD